MEHFPTLKDEEEVELTNIASAKTDGSAGYDSNSQMPVPVMPSGTVELKPVQKSPSFREKLFSN